MPRVILSLFLFVGLMPSFVLAEHYKIDPVHSTVGFSVQHMMVSNVSGQFEKYEGVAIYDPNNLINSKIEVTIAVASINTHNDKRDAHLRGQDFFDEAKFPFITFVSKKITPNEIVGDITIKGVTKEVVIPSTILGPVKALSGSTVIGISGGFRINRQDYGINWNKVLDQGGAAVSNEVMVNFSVEASGS